MKLRQGHHEPRNLWRHDDHEAPESKSGECVGQVFDTGLATEIVDAYNAVTRIRELHLPDHGGPDSTPYCNTCRTDEYPCPTLRALEATNE